MNRDLADDITLGKNADHLVVIHHRDASDSPLGQKRNGESDRKSTRLNSSHKCASRMPSSACTKQHHNHHSIAFPTLSPSIITSPLPSYSHLNTSNIHCP